jgi:hypothetical protein
MRPHKETMMKKVIVLGMVATLGISGFTLEASAGGRGGAGGSHSVKGYYRKDGTYVAPHHRTSPDSSTSNNWSTKGNMNPYTGKEGTVDPKVGSPSATQPAPPPPALATEEK